ncbi:MAG TPA: nitroreductase [Alphaproteobacteria bacterium]|jgi:nitroreductase
MNPPVSNLKTVSDDAGSAALDVILSRRSNAALTTPVPEGEDLDLIIEAGLRASDHDRMRPWRFQIIRGKDIEKLWVLYEAAMRRRMPDVSAAMIEGTKIKLFKAPMIIALGCKIQPGKIMEIEQLFSTACAGMNMMNAIHALGYAGKWVTGDNMYDAEVNKAFGYTAPDRLVGMIYVGTATEEPPKAATPKREEFVSDWTGPIA